MEICLSETGPIPTDNDKTENTECQKAAWEAEEMATTWGWSFDTKTVRIGFQKRGQ